MSNKIIQIATTASGNAQIIVALREDGSLQKIKLGTEHVVFDLWHAVKEIPRVAAETKYDAALQNLRPFILLRPQVFPEGNKWCALYGQNIQDGVAAFGDTPAAAALQFDFEWLNQKPAQNY